VVFFTNTDGSQAPPADVIVVAMTGDSATPDSPGSKCDQGEGLDDCDSVASISIAIAMATVIRGLAKPRRGYVMLVGDARRRIPRRDRDRNGAAGRYGSSINRRSLFCRRKSTRRPRSTRAGRCMPPNLPHWPISIFAGFMKHRWGDCHVVARKELSGLVTGFRRTTLEDLVGLAARLQLTAGGRRFRRNRRTGDRIGHAKRS